MATSGGPGHLDQLGSDLLEEVPPLLRRERRHQVLLGRGENALEADHYQIAKQMRPDVLGPPAQVLLLEPGDALADRCLHFPPRIHDDLGGNRFAG
ncbi:MAG TPA: hypothetical protein VKE40_17080 [Gemmataceae bacterium]|nr:hypothetical protein [Gemmataceae bacterium]